MRRLQTSSTPLKSKKPSKPTPLLRATDTVTLGPTLEAQLNELENKHSQTTHDLKEVSLIAQDGLRIAGRVEDTCDILNTGVGRCGASISWLWAFVIACMLGIGIAGYAIYLTSLGLQQVQHALVH